MAESNWNSNAYNENPPKWYSPEYNKAVRGVVGQAAMAPINAARNQIAEDINSAVDPEYGVNKSRQYWENNPGYYPDSLNPSAIAGVSDKEVYSKYFNRAAPYGALSITQPTGLSPVESLSIQPAPEPANTPNTNVTQDPATPFQILKSNPNQPTEGLSPTSADPQKGILSQQQTNQTGIVGDPSVTRLQAQVGNRMAGVGDGFGNLEPAPQPPIKQSYAEQMKDIGDRVALDQNSIPDWHESDSFNYALINFGLNLLSGNDLANSFSNASTTFIDMFGREKREIWAEDLRRQGYDDTEIQRYIETGDNKVLTNPFEKKARMMDYNLKAAQLDQALYETSPEMRKYNIDRQNWEDRIQLTEIQDRRAQSAADLALRREEMKMRRQEAAERRAERKALAGAKYQSQYAKDKKYGTMALQSLNEYQGIQERYGDVMSGKGLGKLWDAATIDSMFSGNQKAETFARLTNPKVAEIINAERGFLGAVLRGESGASINKSEYMTYGERYFPRPGDSPERIAQKDSARAVSVLAMQPDASVEIKSAVDGYTKGRIKHLAYDNGKAFISQDGKNWQELE